MAIDLHQLPNVWHAESLSRAKNSVVASGYAPLDTALGGGWATPCLMELLIDHYGIGELTLLLPLLDALAASRPSTTALWINPPYAPHALALQQHGLDPTRHWMANDLSQRDAAWAFELSLRSGACHAVLGWLQQPSTAILRRLKLATSTGQTTGILFRPQRASDAPSPSSVRLALASTTNGLEVHLLKIQGRRQSTFVLDLHSRTEHVRSP
ncbi:translesion DNA synthesis-associated protein ImuA [Povalibacter sp.]|uniref:translesion DNA synthesis-associated protein ImuA n=1 Tax=Povalibacter sp. TaxID=1962978 RepID=UPI002F3FE8A2